MREREPVHLNEKKRVPKRLEQEKELNLYPIFIIPHPCNFEVFSKNFIQLINYTLQLSKILSDVIVDYKLAKLFKFKCRKLLLGHPVHSVRQCRLPRL